MEQFMKIWTCRSTLLDVSSSKEGIVILVLFKLWMQLSECVRTFVQLRERERVVGENIRVLRLYKYVFQIEKTHQTLLFL